MKKYTLFLLLLSVTFQLTAQTLTQKIDEAKFFADESIVNVNIVMDVKYMLANKLKEGRKFPAHLTAKFEDGTEASGPVILEVRGKYRRQNCTLPPLKINFKSDKSPVLTSLGSIKLVNVCEIGRRENNEFILKEYLTYKIFNQLTDKSFRVRLLRINYIDSAGKRKPIEEYGFLIEDLTDLAKRNGCVEKKASVSHTELSDRTQMTKVSIFEYMIGNSDWSVPAKHNIKLIVSKEDTNSIPFAVPYDFDHSGLVKTDYALPPPNLDITDVTQRSYRGFVRTMDELTEVTDEYFAKKESIYSLIKNFTYISESTRKKMLSFIDDFYHTISKSKNIKAEFINNARKI